MYGYSDLGFARLDVDRAGRIGDPEVVYGAGKTVEQGVALVAVPTSVGYGASFGGIAALLTMLNSCAPGVVVANIDNGFGAGVFATRVARAAHRAAAR